MNDELKAAIREYLKENLRVEVLDTSRNWHGYPRQPEMQVRLMLEGEVLSEDKTELIHTHGDD